MSQSKTLLKGISLTVPIKDHFTDEGGLKPVDGLFQDSLTTTLPFPEPQTPYPIGTVRAAASFGMFKAKRPTILVTMSSNYGYANIAADTLNAEEVSHLPTQGTVNLTAIPIESEEITFPESDLLKISVADPSLTTDFTNRPDYLIKYFNQQGVSTAEEASNVLVPLYKVKAYGSKRNLSEEQILDEVPKDAFRFETLGGLYGEANEDETLDLVPTVYRSSSSTAFTSVSLQDLRNKLAVNDNQAQGDGRFPYYHHPGLGSLSERYIGNISWHEEPTYEILRPLWWLARYELGSIVEDCNGSSNGAISAHPIASINGFMYRYRSQDADLPAYHPNYLWRNYLSMERFDWKPKNGQYVSPFDPLPRFHFGPERNLGLSWKDPSLREGDLVPHRLDYHDSELVGSLSKDFYQTDKYKATVTYDSREYGAKAVFLPSTLEQSSNLLNGMSVIEFSMVQELLIVPTPEGQLNLAERVKDKTAKAVQLPVYVPVNTLSVEDNKTLRTRVFNHLQLSVGSVITTEVDPNSTLMMALPNFRFRPTTGFNSENKWHLTQSDTPNRYKVTCGDTSTVVTLHPYSDLTRPYGTTIYSLAPLGSHLQALTLNSLGWESGKPIVFTALARGSSQDTPYTDPDGNTVTFTLNLTQQ